jgi:hypothetical protein
MVRTHNVPHKFVNPTIPVRIAFGAENMSMAVTWTFLCFNDEECMSVFLLLICLPSVTSSLLASNLSASDRNRTEMGSATLQ